MPKPKVQTGLVAYCGLHCADCHGYTGEVADLARDLRKKLREYRYDLFAGFAAESGFAKAFQEYPTCYEVLGQMVKFRCRKGCRAGGGNPFCRIRKCCQKKGLEGCWKCPDFESCDRLDFLVPVHGDAHIRNLRAIRKKGLEEFMKGKTNWYCKSE